MARCPAPLALATNAFPMASVVSARRTVSSVGSRIWVRPQSPHLALRGVWVTRPAPTPRTVRVRPWPCGRSAALHPGQPMSPASSICSASDALATTITDDVSIHACHGFLPRRLREGVNSCGGQRVLGRRRHDHADEHRLVNAPMNQQPRQRCDRPFIRAAGFLVTVMVQIISRIPPTSSDSLMTIPPPVIGIQDESQHVGWLEQRLRVRRL